MKYDWDEQSYPLGIVNSDESIKFCRIPRESTIDYNAYQLTYNDIKYYFNITSRYVDLERIFILEKRKAVHEIERVNRKHKADFTTNELLEALEDALLGYYELQTFSSETGKRLRDAGARISCVFE